MMRDVQPALALAALKSSVAEQRTEDDLDLHRVRHDAPENAVRMLPHTMNVGSGLLPPAYVLARSASATSSGPRLSIHPSIACPPSAWAASPSGNEWPSSDRPAHQTRMTAQWRVARAGRAASSVRSSFSVPR